MIEHALTEQKNGFPKGSVAGAGPARSFRIATYNVHRWTGLAGGRRWNPDLASAVIGELGADVIALQEVLRPSFAEDPLQRIAEEHNLYLAYTPARTHRSGELGNAILSRWPISTSFRIDLSFTRLEQRAAIAAQFNGDGYGVAIVATHLALVDRTRKRQVHSLLEHPELQGPTILLGDMNAWRRCRATRRLDRELTALHHNDAWPATYPATRPVLALDRIYARNAHVTAVSAHISPAARRGSDHLPVVATIELLPALPMPSTTESAVLR